MDPPIKMDILLNNWGICFAVFDNFPGSLNLEYIIEQLVKRNADISTVTDLNDKGTCPLLQFLRSRHCSARVLRLLFLNGVNVNANNTVRRLALVTALRNHARRPTLIRVILNAGAEVDILRFYEECALCLALINRATPPVIKLLLQAGCSPNCGQRFPPFFHALTSTKLKYRLEIFKLLIDGGASLQMLTRDGQSVLCFALQDAVTRKDIDFLIGLGFPPDACSCHGSPLLCAMHNGDGRALSIDLAEALLDHSSNTTQGLDSLYRLSDTIMNPIENELPGNEIRFDLRSYESRFQGEYGTLLHAVTYNDKCSSELIELLVKRGVPIGKQSSEGETAMHVILKKGRDVQSIINLLVTLIKLGCPVNVRNWAGRTPLTLAVLLELDVKILKVLLDAGAHVTRQNVYDGISVLETALDFYSDLKFLHRMEMAVELKVSNAPGKRQNFLSFPNEWEEKIQEQLEHTKWDCLSILFQYSFLENPKLNVEELEVIELVEGRRDAESIKLFANKCLLELRELELMEVGNNLTLLQLVSTPINQLHKLVPSISEENNFDFDKLLRALEGTKLVKYRDMVLDRVPRKFMEVRLKQLQVYSIRHSPRFQVFTLNYHCVCEIVKYLSNKELMRLILAFHNRVNGISEVI